MGIGNNNTDGFSNCPMIWLEHPRAFEPDYQTALMESWNELEGILNRVLENDGILDQFAGEIQASWEDDYERWNRTEEDGTPHTFDEILKEGFAFVGWEREDHSMYELGDTFEGDTVLYAVYLPEEESIKAENIYFNSYDVWLDIHQKRDSCVYTLAPEDAVERTVFWTSSDPEIAQV